MTALLSNALCGTSDVKESLGITDSSKDNLIIRKINQATTMIENYCQRSFGSRTYTDEYYEGVGGTTINLKNFPVTTFTSMSIRDSTINEAKFESIDSQFYYVDMNAGIVEYLGRFVGGYQRWKVTYTAGYTAIPSDIAEACATLAAYLVVRGPNTYDVQTLQEGQRMTRYQQKTNLESLFQKVGIDAILDPYTMPVMSGRP